MVSGFVLFDFILMFLSAIVLFQCKKKPKKRDVMGGGGLEKLKKETNTNKECNENKKSVIANNEFVFKITDTKLVDQSEQNEKRVDDVDKTQDEGTKENTKTGNEDYEKVTDEKIADFFKSDTLDDVSQKNEFKKLITVAPRRMIWREKSGIQFLTVINNTTETLAIKMRCSNNDVYTMSPIFGKIEPKKSIEIRITRAEAPQAADRISVVAAPLTIPANSEKAVQAFFKSYHGNICEANLTLLPDRL